MLAGLHPKGIPADLILFADTGGEIRKTGLYQRPCSQLREFMRDKIKREGISNVKVLDREILCLPYEADPFDVVCSGHVAGNF